MSVNKNLFKKRKPDLSNSQLMDELFNGPFEDFRPAQQFQGYDINFLKKSIMYKFQQPVLLVKTQYNFHVKKIGKMDIDALNAIFTRFGVNLKIGEGNQYMNGKTTKFLDEKYPGEERKFGEEQQWMITIAIQGFKTGSSGHATPVWKIDEAKITFW